MSTSRTSLLSEPTGTERVPISMFAYMRARNKHRLYSLVIKEFEKSGLSQADLSKRLGKNPDVVCRLLAAPRNWQVDTISDLLFAISGAEAVYGVANPLRQSPRNDTRPEWLGQHWGQKTEAVGATTSTGVLVLENAQQ